MKKVFGFAISLVAIFSLTACGGKTVTCTKTEDEQTTSIKATFNGNNVTKATIESAQKVDSQYLDLAYTYRETAAKSINYDGVKASATKGKDSVSLKLEIDPSKISDDTYDQLGLTEDDFKSQSSEDFIKTMTEDGYTCK